MRRSIIAGMLFFLSVFGMVFASASILPTTSYKPNSITVTVQASPVHLNGYFIYYTQNEIWLNMTNTASTPVNDTISFIYKGPPSVNGVNTFNVAFTPGQTLTQLFTTAPFQLMSLTTGSTIEIDV